MEALKMPARRSMAADLVELLRERIRSGELARGDRLPPERALVAELGISRTVVREAIARLSAEGWVEARQGSGVFVRSAPQAFQVSATELADLEDVLRLLELRIAIETEMAGLAAERRTGDDLVAIDNAVAAIEEDLRLGGDGVAADIAMHNAIAHATHNQYFVRIIEFLGASLVPRRNVATGEEQAAARAAYLCTIQGEHRRLVEAIRKQDVGAAKRAARMHLERSLRRGRRRLDPARSVDS